MTGHGRQLYCNPPPHLPTVYHSVTAGTHWPGSCRRTRHRGPLPPPIRYLPTSRSPSLLQKDYYSVSAASHSHPKQPPTLPPPFTSTPLLQEGLLLGVRRHPLPHRAGALPQGPPQPRAPPLHPRRRPGRRRRPAGRRPRRRPPAHGRQRRAAVRRRRAGAVARMHGAGGTPWWHKMPAGVHVRFQRQLSLAHCRKLLCNFYQRGLLATSGGQNVALSWCKCPHSTEAPGCQFSKHQPNIKMNVRNSERPSTK